MRIAMTGSSGFVGGAVRTALVHDGHEVVPFVRPGSARAGGVSWDPATGAVDAAALGPIDAVIHLAGESVAGGRWSAARKQRIASRGPVTERLCTRLAALPRPPRVLIAASATGIYGSRGDEELDEGSVPGSDFLAAVAKAWEAGTAPLVAAGTRVVNLRLGMVLDPAGGALRKMLPAFRLGAGGRLGSGRQWVSWITRADLVRAVQFALARAGLAGPVLAVAPEPVTNAQFTAALGRAVHRPTWLPVPAFALRMLFGEMTDALLLASQRCRPVRLTAAGFAFTHPTIELALQDLLAK